MRSDLIGIVLFNSQPPVRKKEKENSQNLEQGDPEIVQLKFDIVENVQKIVFCAYF